MADTKQLAGLVNDTGEFLTFPIFSVYGKGGDGVTCARFSTEIFSFLDKTDEEWIEADKHKMIESGLFEIDKCREFITQLRELTISSGLEVTFPEYSFRIYSCFLNARGEIAMVQIFKDARDFSEGLAAVKSNDKWCYIDREGKIVLQLEGKGSSVKDFRNGLASVRGSYMRKDGSHFDIWRMVENEKNTFTSLYLESTDFSGGFEVASSVGMYHLVDSSGEIHLSSRIKMVFIPVIERLIMDQTIDGIENWHLTELTGKKLSNKGYGKFRYYGGGCIVVINEKRRMGLLHKDGTLVQPCKFRAIEYMPSGGYILMKDRNSGFTDSEGNLTTKLSFRFLGWLTDPRKTFEESTKTHKSISSYDLYGEDILGE